MWNLAEGRTPKGKELSIYEIGNEISLLTANMDRDVIDLYDMGQG